MLGDSASELVEQFGTDTFKAVHDSDRDGLVYFSGDGRIEYANRAALELFQVDREIIGENIIEQSDSGYPDLPVDLIHPADHFELARETYEKGVPNRSELVVIDGDERREVEVLWGPVERNGDIVGVVGSYRDISPRPDIHDQLAAEASRLEQQRHFLASVIDVLDDGIVVFDERATLQWTNPAASRLLGLETPAEGTELGALLETSTLTDPERFSQQLRRTTSSEGSTTEFHQTDEGERPSRRIEVQMTTAGPDPRRLICTLSEVTTDRESGRMQLLSSIADLDPAELEPAKLADRLIDLVADRLELDFAVLTRREDDNLVPVAWRGVLLDEKMRIDLAEREKLQSALQAGSPHRVEEWSWRAETDDTMAQLVIPLSESNAFLGALHLGFTRSLVEGALDAPLAQFEGSFARALGAAVSGRLGAVVASDPTLADRSQLGSVLESLPEGVVLYTRRGEVVLVNSKFEAITGYDEWEDLNTDTRPFQLLQPDGTPLARSDWPYFQAVHRGEHCHAEALLDFGHSQREVRVEGVPLNGPDSQLYLGILRDITERRRLDRRKDEFLSIASHELRSPLTPLTGVLQLARRQRERGREVDLSLLTRAERQVSRLTRLIDGLLDMTRIETGRIELEFRDTEFRSFVENRLQPWRLNPKEIELDVGLPDEPLHVEIDQDRIGQVVTNIVDNAIKYSNPNGVIRIDVSDAGDRVELAVEDEGVGMDDEMVDHIFDRFFHGRAGSGGPRSMGLGLYICRQIVEQHHGDIAVESTKGVGTRVEISVPKRQPDAPEAGS